MKHLPKFSVKREMVKFVLLVIVLFGMIGGMFAFGEWYRWNQFQSPIVFRPLIIKREPPVQIVVKEVKAAEIVLTEEEKKDAAIRKYFPEQFALAKAVSMAEGYRSNGINSNVPVEYSVGLMQINLLAHWKKVPGTTFSEKESCLKDYDCNVKIARIIYEASGWGPWAGYTSGGFRKFL